MVDGNVLTKLTGLIPVVSQHMSTRLGVDHMTSNIIVQQLWSILSYTDIADYVDVTSCILVTILCITMYYFMRGIYRYMKKTPVVVAKVERFKTVVRIYNVEVAYRLSEFILKRPDIYGIYPSMTIDARANTTPNNQDPIEFEDSDVNVSGNIYTETITKDDDKGGTKTIYAYIVTTYGRDVTAANYVLDITKRSGRHDQLTGAAETRKLYVLSFINNKECKYTKRLMYEDVKGVPYEQRLATTLCKYAGNQLKETTDYITRNVLSASARNHVLYHGEPGNGKSSLVYLIADIFSRHVVQGSKLSIQDLENVVNNGVLVRNLYDTSIYPPSEIIILLDEVDGMIDEMRKHNDKTRSESPMNMIHEQQHDSGIPRLLTLLQDGSPAVDGGVWVFATTNHLKIIQSIPALCRRFKVIHVGHLNIDTLRDVCVMRFGNDVCFNPDDFKKMDYNVSNSSIITIAEQSKTYEEFVKLVLHE